MEDKMAPQEQDMRYPPAAAAAKEEQASEAASSASGAPAAASASNVSNDLVTELLTSVYRAEGTTAQGFAAIRQRLDAIEAQLGISHRQETGEGQTSKDVPAGGSVVAEVISDEETKDASTEQEPETFPELPPIASPATPAPTAQPVSASEPSAPTAQPVSQPTAAMPQPIQPVRDVRPVAAPHTGGELEAIVFGQDLAYHESLLPQRQQLMMAVRHGDENALGLIGQLLIVRAATLDRLPTLLKDVGEAWYRWRMDDSGQLDPLRDALIAWLHMRLEAVGLGNRIELVRVGDRYDSKRHNAKNRGIEVTGVGGWVVLRDNGNVYTKATVSVA
jgi:hypothetical protein